MMSKTIGREAELSRRRRRRALLGVLSVAILSGCGGTPEERSTEATQPTITEPTAAMAPARPELAREKVVRQAPAFKRATQEEVEAFLARKNGANLMPAPTSAELDDMVAEATANDPARRKDGLKRLHDTIRTLPQAELRRDLGERFRAAQLANLSAVSSIRERSGR